MSVGYIGSIPSPSMLQSIIDMRQRLDDLQRQFGTGQKSSNYAGLGLDRGVSISLRAQLAATTSFDSTIQTVGVRLSVAQQALTGIDQLARDVKSSTQESVFSFDQNGQTSQQRNALTSLNEILSILNTRAGDRYLFSGQAVDQPAVVSGDLILNGDVSHAGLKQVIDERKQADFGANGLGRLTITPAGTTITLAEDGAHPFGFKISAASSTLSNATFTAPAGSPATMSVDFTGLPANGEKVTISLTLPDGSKKELTLTATTNSPVGEGQFAIGATAADTAANFQAALSTSLTDLASTDLAAASAMEASDNFFGSPPQRVDGPPFDSATALIDGSADTVSWYVGENGADPARSTSTARVDPTMSVNYGMRANEQALRLAVQSVAAFAAVSSSPSDPNAGDVYKALASRVNSALAGTQGQQKLADIEAEIASAQTTFTSAKERHAQTSDMLTTLLQRIESVPQEEVGVQILSLQTSLQASLQTTAMLSQISLINYLP